MKQSEVNDLRSLKVYSPPILNVLHCVCVVLNKSPKIENIKALLNEPNLIEKLKQLSFYSLTDRQHLQLDKYLHHAQFNPVILSRESSAVFILAQWVFMMHKWYVASVV